MRTLSDLSLRFCFSRSSDSSAHLWWVLLQLGSVTSPPVCRASGTHPLGRENQQTPRKQLQGSPNWPPVDANTKCCCYVKQMPPIARPSSSEHPRRSRAKLAVPQLEADAKCQRWAGSARWAGQEITSACQGLGDPSSPTPAVTPANTISLGQHSPPSLGTLISARRLNKSRWARGPRRVVLGWRVRCESSRTRNKQHVVEPSTPASHALASRSVYPAWPLISVSDRQPPARSLFDQ